MRKPGTKKGQTVGSGGRRSKGLEGRGPTPRAEERDKHPAARRSRAKARQDARPGGGSGSAAGGGQGRGRSRGTGAEQVFGRNAVLEALRAGVPATALHVQQFVDSDDRVREVLLTAADRRIPLLEGTRAELDRMADGGVHQGLVLKVPPYDYAQPGDLLDRAAAAGAPPLLVALDGVTDPRNLGAVTRSAAAFGAQGVVVPERRAAGMTASAWKTSAGAAARVPVARAVNLTRALKEYQKAGCMVVGLTADGDTSLDELDREILAGPLVLVVGGEGAGLSRLVGETCDLRVTIPMDDDTESLNASVAAGIALYAAAASRR
jgi:23S rRNA (guanosine2251-2'-O)-methyltransferase